MSVRSILTEVKHRLHTVVLTSGFLEAIDFVSKYRAWFAFY